VYNLTLVVRRVLAGARAKYLGVCVLVASAFVAAVPAAALATESAGEEKVKAVATQVGSEGVTIILVILGALAALIAMVIILPKAVKMIKRFI
jgi:hypothetical protein